jgi:hypothetical protein
MALALALPGSARAECARAYTLQEMSQDISNMTRSLRALDETSFRQSGARMQQSLPCLRTKLRPNVHASAYRYVGAYEFLNGDKAQAARWFRLALELDPGFQWDVNELAMDNPMRAAFDQERSAAGASPVAIEGKELVAPAGSKLLLDGRALDEAAATTDRPHLLQVVGNDNTVRQVFLIDGNAIPDQYLQDQDPSAAVADVTAPEDEYAVQSIKRVRPPLKTPLMITGGVVALGAGALYGASFATKAKFEAATTQADMIKHRTTTNTLVIASGVTLAVGLGVEYTAIILDGNPGMMLRGRF